MQASQQGLTSAAARYGVARGMLSVLGPAMWALFAGELAVKSIGTDYGRVVRAVYTLAQVRRQLAPCATVCPPIPSRAARMLHTRCQAFICLSAGADGEHIWLVNSSTQHMNRVQELSIQFCRGIGPAVLLYHEFVICYARK